VGTRERDRNSLTKIRDAETLPLFDQASGSEEEQP